MPRKAPTIVEERRNTLGDFERNLKKKESQALVFKTYAEGAEAALKPVVAVGVGYGIYRGMKYIAQGIQGFDVSIFGTGDWWDRRIAAAESAYIQTDNGQSKGWGTWIGGFLTGTDKEHAGENRKKYWWED